MSTTYRIHGTRYLRKYTAEARTPVYAFLADAKKAADSMCMVPWERVRGDVAATTTLHTEEGLDWNEPERDRFDAAMWCADHADEMHRAYAQASCYVFELPASAVGKAIENLSVRVTSDPYNPYGARIAAMASDTLDLPTACAVVRTGDVYRAPGADGLGAAPRLYVKNADGSYTWYANSEVVNLESGGENVVYTATGTSTGSLVAKKYLFVFVCLENYNRARNGWLEGCSYIENDVSVTMASAVAGWSEDELNYCLATVPSTALPVLRGGVVADVPGAASPVVSATVLPSGTDVRMSSGAADDVAQVGDEAGAGNSAMGVATLYGMLASGSVAARELASASPHFRAFGAGFCVRRGGGAVYRDAQGAEEPADTLTLTASSLLVPFGIPAGYVAERVGFDWSAWLRTAAPTPGARFGFWVKPGSFDRELPAALLSSRVAYDGTETDPGVDGWRLLGTADAAAGSAVFDAVSAGGPLSVAATVLVTAYMPQELVDTSAADFACGTNAMWYDSITPDDLLALLSESPYFSESATYSAGDLVRRASNEAAVWAACKGTRGGAFTAVATDGSRWVAAAPDGLWFSRGGDRFSRSSMTSAVSGVVYTAGYFVAWAGSKLYVAGSDLSSWTAVDAPAAVASVEAGAASAPFAVCTASGVYMATATAVEASPAAPAPASAAARGPNAVVAATDRGMYHGAGAPTSRGALEPTFRQVNAVAGAPSASLALADSRVFASADQATWTRVPGFEGAAAAACSDGSAVVVAAADGLYVYDGAALAKADAPSVAFASVCRAAGVWFAFTADKALYRSADGRAWTAATVTGDGDDDDLSLSGGLVYGESGGLVTGTPHGYAKSADGGLTWQVRVVDAPVSTTDSEGNAVVIPPEAVRTPVAGINALYTASDGTYGRIAYAATDKALMLLRVPQASDLTDGGYAVGTYVEAMHVKFRAGAENSFQTASWACGPWHCLSYLGSAIPEFAPFLFAGGEAGLFAFRLSDSIVDGRASAAGTTGRGRWVQQDISSATGPVYDVFPVVSGGVATAFALTRNGLFRWFGQAAAQKKHPMTILPYVNYNDVVDVTTVPEFSSGKAYAVGDLVTRPDRLGYSGGKYVYRCTTAGKGAWNADRFCLLYTRLPRYSTLTAYQPGDVVVVSAAGLDYVVECTVATGDGSTSNPFDTDSWKTIAATPMYLRFMETEPYYEVYHASDRASTASSLSLAFGNYLHGAKYIVKYYDGTSGQVEAGGLGYMQVQALDQYVELDLDEGDIVFYTPAGVRKTISLAWASTGDAAVPGNWHATIDGGEFGGTELQNHPASETGLSDDVAACTCQYTPEDGPSLVFALYVRLGELVTDGTGTRRTIVGAYARSPMTTSPGDSTTESWSVYTVRGQQFRFTFSDEGGSRVLNTSFDDPMWVNMSTAVLGGLPAFSSVKWMNGKLVATVSGSGRVYCSTDLGCTWKADATFVEYSPFRFVAMSGATAVAATESDGLFVSHDNGATWTRTLRDPLAYRGIAYLNGRWFAWTADALMTSTDGDAWTAVEEAPAGATCIAYDHGRYVLGTGHGAYWSADGLSWEESGLGYVVAGLAPHGGKWFAATDDGVHYSGDAMLLDRVALPSQAVPGFYVLERVSSKWVGGSMRGEGLSYSSDGLEWHQTNVTSGSFYAISEVAGCWVAGGDAGLYRSTNGVTWTKVDGADGIVQRIASVLDEDSDGAGSDLDYTVALAAGPGSLYRSVNGTAWTQAFPAFTRVCGGATGKFVAVSSAGLFTSSNGTDWFPVPALYGKSFSDLKYEDTSSSWLAKSETGWYMSTNSTTWTAVPTGAALSSTASLDDLTRRGSTYFGYHGSTTYYYNGSAWVSATPSVGTVVGIAHDGAGKLFVAGSSGVMSSTDGTTWAAVDGIIGTPAKILSNGAASSWIYEAVAVLTSEGRVYAKGPSDDGFADVTPEGATVDGLFFTPIQSVGYPWWFATAGSTAYFVQVFGEAWSEAPGAPAGIAGVRYTRGNAYAFAADGVYTMINPAAGQGSYSWALLASGTGFYGLGEMNSSQALVFGAGGCVLQTDDDMPHRTATRVFSGGGSSFRAVATDGLGTCVAAGGGAAYVSTDNGATWTWLETLSFAVADLAYFGGKWLAATATGVKYSSDLSTWTASSLTASTTRICVGEESAVACHTGGVSMTSDGATWTSSAFAGVTTLNARFASDGEWTRVPDISGTFLNLEWDSGSSKFVATTADRQYFSATGATWTSQAWNQLATRMTNNSSLSYAKWMSIYNGKFYYRSSATSSITSNELTGVSGTALDIWAPNTARGANYAAWVLRTSAGYYRAYYATSAYKPAVEALTAPGAILTDTRWASAGNTGVSIRDGVLKCAPDTTVESPYWTNSSVYCPSADVETKIESNKVYWRYPRDTGDWHEVTGFTARPGCNVTQKTVIPGVGFRISDYGPDSTDIDGDGNTSEEVVRSVVVVDTAFQTATRLTADVFGACLGSFTMTGGGASYPVVVTTMGLLVQSSSYYTIDGVAHLIDSYSAGWEFYPFDKSPMAYASGLFVKASGSTLSYSNNGGSSWTAWSSFPGTGTIRSVGYLNSRFTVVTDDAVYTTTGVNTAWTTSAFPSELPAYVASDGGVRLKAEDNALWTLPPRGCVAVGYSQSSQDLFRIHPVLLTVVGADWVQHPEIECLYESGLACPLYAVADIGAEWIVSGALGSASGSLDASTTWERLYNSYVAPVVAMAERGGFRFAALRGLGALCSIDRGASWHRTLLNVGTPAAFAADGSDRWVAVGDFGVRRSIGFTGSGLVYAGTEYGFTTVEGDDALTGTPFHDVAYHGGAWLAVGDAGIFRCATSGAPETWTKVSPGACRRLLRSATCWIALSDSCVYRSTDGKAWTAVPVGSGSYDIGTVSDGAFVVASSAMAVENAAQELYCSGDGLTWTRASVMLSSAPGASLGRFTCIAAHDGVLLATRERYAATGVGGVWRSDDRGVTWTSVPSMAGVALDRVLWSTHDRCWLAGGSSGVFYSTDAQEWVRMLPAPAVGTFTVNCIADTSTESDFGFEPNPTAVPSEFNLLATAELALPVARLYRCKAEIRTPGVFNPAQWEEVAKPARARMYGAKSLCVPDITLYN